MFCLRYLQSGYDVGNCSKEQQIQLLEQLRLLSQLTWNETRASHKHGLGSEKIPQKQIKRPMPSGLAITDDVTLIAFRFAGKNPMIGYRTGSIFRLLWLDHDFSVYDHGN